MTNPTDTVAIKKPRAGRPKRTAPGDDENRLAANRIFEAALALIDAKGVAEFTIRELATALGVAPAAIYWHVPNRDALLAGAVNLAMRGVADAVPLRGVWQNRLRKLLGAFRAALRAHPKLAPAVASEMSYNASFDEALLERIVGMLEDAGFDGAALVDAFNVVVAAMCGFATLELSSAPVTADWQTACRQHVSAVDKHRYKKLGRHLPALEDNAFLVRWTDGTEKPLDSGFDAWVDVIVLGLERKAANVAGVGSVGTVATLPGQAARAE
ncbi:TetR family transcriptional regulator [Paraburkholderia sp.]|uniref:TetR/AcrR family transcriptional regulator n=1 Tax=Paraburkholderia sp. TaxID=1926495 RepID=UPI0023A51FCB|nr:TetR family transcriptional regulator [Paraburkholderia sp.]MDE1179303.1 TetR family transcriptional regulator [Paraburkholderia sp.]